MFLLSLRKDHFTYLTIKFLGPTPPLLYLQKFDITGVIKQKGDSRTPAGTLFTDTYASCSKKIVSTEPKKRLFQ